MKLLLATANQHKRQEIEELVANVAGLEFLTLHDFPRLELPEESGTTMRENARLKAAHCARETGLASLADDSGIEVDALDGAPGVRSARWLEGTDAERVEGLLKRLSGVPAEGRTARYRCAICLALPATDEMQRGDLHYEDTEAVCEGRIAFEPSGANGFGYDPVFQITAESGAEHQWIGQTMADAPPAVKAGISHRSRALELIKPILSRLPG